MCTEEYKKVNHSQALVFCFYNKLLATHPTIDLHSIVFDWRKHTHVRAHTTPLLTSSARWILTEHSFEHELLSSETISGFLKNWTNKVRTLTGVYHFTLFLWIPCSCYYLDNKHFSSCHSITIKTFAYHYMTFDIWHLELFILGIYRCIFLY